MAHLFKTTVAGAELIALRDSWFAVPPTEFYPATTDADWEPYREVLDGDGNLRFPIGCCLIRSAGKTVLVDTGLGGREKQQKNLPIREPTRLPAVMEEAGVRPEEIDIVLFSHLHLDHTGWNTIDRDGVRVPLFANARHVVQRTEWAYWTAADERKRFALVNMVWVPVVEAGLLDLVEGEHAPTPTIVTLPTPGHTPGHVSFVVGAGADRVYVLGDAAHHPVQLTETDWNCTGDVDPDTAARTRRMLLDRIESEGALMVGGHFPFPGLGYAAREGTKRVFRPVA